MYIIIQEVDPLKLIPGEYYYLENKTDKTMKAKGQFLYIYEHEKRFGGTQAAFRIVPSKKIKSKKMEFHYSNSVRGFPISSYKFYKPLPEEVIDRHAEKEKELRVDAATRMINSKFPYPEDEANMLSKGPYVPPPTYEQTPQKNDVGTQLKSKIGEYFGGRRR